MAAASPCGGSERRTGPGPFDKEAFASSGQVEPAADPLAYHIDEPPPKRQQRQQAAATPVATEEAAGFPRTKSSLNLAPTEKVKDEYDAASSFFNNSAQLTKVLDGVCPPEHGEAVRPVERDGRDGLAASPCLVAGSQAFAASQGHDSVTDTQTE